MWDRPGIEYLRSMMAGGDRPPISGLLDIRLVAVEEGRVVLASLPTAKLYNTAGMVHGGYTAALLDTACGYVVQTKLPAGRTFVTLELKVTYHRPIHDSTGELRVEGTMVSIGRRIAASQARLTDAGGRLHASATSTLLLG